MVENGSGNDQQKNQGGNESMKEDVNKNGNKTNEKTEPERDESGRFLPGCEGGPGRGKKSFNELDLDGIDFWTELANKFTPDLNSKSDTTRQRVGKILIEIKKLKDTFELKRGEGDEASAITSPSRMAILKIINAIKRTGEDLVETAKKVQKICPYCDKIGEPARKFDFPCDQDKDDHDEKELNVIAMKTSS